MVLELEERFKAFIRERDLFHPNDRLLLAVSGGVDSTVLCELCHRAGFHFSIAHCNFQLRGDDSNRDETFVKELAAKYKVPFYSRSFDTRSVSAQEKKSIEEAARDLRYGWFSELLDPERSPVPAGILPRYVVTGHHADDNIETVVMHFFRGTGVKGMRGIPVKNNKIVRPMLFMRRRDIEDFAWLHQLPFVTDHTNFETAFARNFFRNRVMTLVREFFPEAEQNVLNNTERFAEADELYRQAMDIHRKKLLVVKGAEVHIPVLKLKKSSPLHSITYDIIKDYGFTAAQTGEVIGLLDSESGKYVASATHRVIRNRSWLIIAPLRAGEAKNVLIEPGDTEINVNHAKLLIRLKQLKPGGHASATDPRSQLLACLDASAIRFPLLLRPWKTGDYFYPLGMKKKKKLARFFIDLKLSKTEKENTWVVESDKKILWVVGHRIDDRFKLTPHTTSCLELEWHPHSLQNAGI